jgi:hypothetical protein
MMMLLALRMLMEMAVHLPQNRNQADHHQDLRMAPPAEGRVIRVMLLMLSQGEIL